MSRTFASKKELTHKWESIRGKNKIIYFVYISNEIFELLCQHIVYDTIRLTLNPFGLVVIIINTRCLLCLPFWICMSFSKFMTLTLTIFTLIYLLKNIYYRLRKIQLF